MNIRKSAPANGVVVDEAAEANSRRRLLVAGGMAAALAVVAATGYFFLSGGDDESDTGLVAAAKRTTSSQPATTPSAGPAAKVTTKTAIKKVSGTTARDPFKALVVEQAAATSGSTGSTSGTGSTGTTGTTASAGSTSSTGSTGTVDPNTTVQDDGTTVKAAAPRAKNPVTIKLVSVLASDTSASFLLDAKPYQAVKPLKTFGTYFRLLTLREGKCGTVQYGDVTFDLCEGQSLTLR